MRPGAAIAASGSAKSCPEIRAGAVGRVLPRIGIPVSEVVIGETSRAHDQPAEEPSRGRSSVLLTRGWTVCRNSARVATTSAGGSRPTSRWCAGRARRPVLADAERSPCRERA